MNWIWVAIAVVGALASILVLARLDGWQRLYAATLVALVAGSSFSASLASTVYYPRFIAVFFLALWTWIGKRPVRPLSQTPLLARALVTGLWAATLVGTVTALWSASRVETLTQSAALAALSFLVHGLVTRRWTTTDDAFGDLSVAFWVIGGSLLVGLLLFAVGYAEAFTSNGRFKGVYINPNRLSLLAALIAPISLALFARFRRWFYLGGAALSATTLLLTETRSAFLALISAAVWVLLRGGIRSILLTTYLLLTVSIAYLFATSVFNLPAVHILDAGIIDRFVDPEGGDLLNHRTVGWSEAFNQWQASPIGGVGYAAAPSVFRDLTASGSLSVDFATVHSSYLQWFMETGTLGMAPLLALLLVSTLICIKAPRHKPEYELMAGGIVVGLVAQLAESAMFGTGQPYPFAFWPLVAALALALPDDGTTDSSRHLVVDRQCSGRRTRGLASAIPPRIRSTSP